MRAALITVLSKQRVRASLLVLDYQRSLGVAQVTTIREENLWGRPRSGEGIDPDHSVTPIILGMREGFPCH